jgi:hypothetical protein
LEEYAKNPSNKNASEYASAEDFFREITKRLGFNMPDDKIKKVFDDYRKKAGKRLSSSPKAGKASQAFQGQNQPYGVNADAGDTEGSIPACLR